MNDIWNFLFSVYDHAVTLAAGCIITVISGAIEKRYKKSISWRCYIIMIMVFLFYATFQAWQDQRALLNTSNIEKTKVETDKIKLEVKIEEREKQLIEKDKKIQELTAELAKKPTIVQFPNTNSVVSDKSNSEEAKKVQATVNEIALRADRANKIQNAWMRTEKDDVLKAEWTKWVSDNIKLLNERLGAAYAIQFNNAHGTSLIGCPEGHTIDGCGYYNDITAKRDLLMRIISEIRH